MQSTRNPKYARISLRFNRVDGSASAAKSSRTVMQISHKPQYIFTFINHRIMRSSRSCGRALRPFDSSPFENTRSNVKYWRERMTDGWLIRTFTFRMANTRARFANYLSAHKNTFRPGWYRKRHHFANNPKLFDSVTTKQIVRNESGTDMRIEHCRMRTLLGCVYEPVTVPIYYTN